MYIKVKSVQDDSGNWYCIPNVLLDQFNNDLNDNLLIESGDFDDKWGGYRTSGDLNLQQLWIEL